MSMHLSCSCENKSGLLLLSLQIVDTANLSSCTEGLQVWPEDLLLFLVFCQYTDLTCTGIYVDSCLFCISATGICIFRMLFAVCRLVMGDYWFISKMWYNIMVLFYVIYIYIHTYPSIFIIIYFYMYLVDFFYETTTW